METESNSSIIRRNQIREILEHERKTRDIRMKPVKKIDCYRFYVKEGTSSDYKALAGFTIDFELTSWQSIGP